MTRTIIFSVSIAVFLFVSCKEEKSSSKSHGYFEILDPSFEALLSKDTAIKIIAEGFDWTEGPLWVENQKMLLFSDIPANTVYKWTQEKGKEVYLKPSGYTGTTPRGGEAGSNALALDKNNKLLLCQHGDRRIAMMDADIGNPQPKFISLSDNYEGKKFDSPNDLAIKSSGEIFFTDPPYGLEKFISDPNKQAPYQGIYLIKDGKTKLLLDSITRPNGIGLLKGEKTLVIANSDNEKANWYAYDIAGDSLVNGRIFNTAMNSDKKEEGAPDGFKVDKNGNVFATGPGGIWVFNETGKLIGKIKIPTVVSNVAFSPDEKTLFVTADMYVLKVTL